MSPILSGSPSAFTRCALVCVASALLLTVFLPMASDAPTTVSTGSIQGNVTDPTGAVFGNAKVTLIDKATGQKASLATNSAGSYASGALTPGDYLVRVEAPG